MSERIGLEGYLGLGSWSPNVLRYLQDVEAMCQAAIRAAKSLGQTNEEVDKGSKAVHSAKEAWNGFGQTLSGVDRFAQTSGRTLLGMSLGVTSLTGAIYGLGGQAARLQGVQAAFEGMGGSIEDMRRSTRGLVGDAMLMENYNRAAMLVSRTFARQLPEAMGYLQQVAMATGDSMDYLLRSLVIGVGRLSPLILDNLGISIKLSEAYEAYAAQLGRTADSLTRTEQQTAIMNATLEALRRNFAGVDSTAGSTQGQLMSLQAQIANLRVEAGRAVLPLLNELLPALNKVAVSAGEMFSSPEFKEGIEDAAEGLSRILDLILKINENPVALTATSGLIGWALLGGTIKKVLGLLGQLIGGINKYGWILATAGTGTAALTKLTQALGYGFGYVTSMISPLLAAIGSLGVAFTAGVVAQKEYKRQIADYTERLRAATPEIVRQTRSWEEYQERVVAALRADRDFTRTLGMLPWLWKDADIAARAYREGLLLTTSAYNELAGIQDDSIWQTASWISKVTDASWAARKFGEEVETLGSRMRSYVKEVGLSSSLDFRQFMLDMQAGAQNATPFGPAQLGGVEGILAALLQDQLSRHFQHYQSLLALQQDYERSSLALEESFRQEQSEAEFSHELTMLQARLQYQAERQSLLVAGRMEEVAELDEAHRIETANAEQQWDLQQQLSERAFMAQGITARAAYIERLEEQRRAYEEEIKTKLLADEAFIGLDVRRQVLLLRTLGVHNAEMLALEVQGYKERAEKAKEFGDFSIALTISVINAQQAALESNLEAAKAAQAEAQAAYAEFSRNILAGLSAPAVPAQKPLETAIDTAKGATVGAARQASESATKTLAQVAKDIRNAVEDAQAAIFKLATFSVPSSVERGLTRLGDYLLMAVRRLYDVYEALNKGPDRVRLGSLQEGMEHIGAIVGVIKPTLETMNALAVYESSLDLPYRMSDLAYDMEYSLRVLYDLYQMLNAPGPGRVRFASLEEGAEHIGKIISVISPAIQAMTDLLGYQTGNLEEVVDIFEVDLFYLLGRFGQMGQRMMTEGMTDAQMFAQGAAMVAESIQGGVGLIRDSAGGLIDVSFGGAAFMPAPSRAYVNVSFGDVHITSDSDWGDLKQRITNTVAAAMEGL